MSHLTLTLSQIKLSASSSNFLIDKYPNEIFKFNIKKQVFSSENTKITLIFYDNDYEYNRNLFGYLSDNTNDLISFTVNKFYEEDEDDNWSYDQDEGF